LFEEDLISNEEDSPSPRGDGNERMKIQVEKFKKIFSRTSRPNSIIRGTNFPWVTGIEFCSSKGLNPLQKGDNHRNIQKSIETHISSVWPMGLLFFALHILILINNTVVQNYLLHCTY
jgi:hypothetical protein